MSELLSRSVLGRSTMPSTKEVLRGVRQLVVLGAGFDARTHRMPQLQDVRFSLLMTQEDGPYLFPTPEPPLNMFRSLLDPRLVRPLVVDWERTAHELIARLHIESLFSLDAVTELACQALAEGRG